MLDVFHVNQSSLIAAANARDLLDLVSEVRLAPPVLGVAGQVQLSVTGGVIPGKTNWVQSSTNARAWQTIATNVLPLNTLTNRFQNADLISVSAVKRFYRVRRGP